MLLSLSIKNSLLLGLCASAAAFKARQADVECYQYAAALPRDTCQSLATFWGLTLDQFKGLNPDVTTCPTLVVGQEYCVDGEYTPLPPSSTSTTFMTSTTPSRSSTKTSSTGLPTPSPTQPGVVQGCTKFYFIEQEDTCNSVLANTGLTLPQLYALNLGVNADCSGLWLGVYVCVARPGASTTSSSKVSTTSTGGNGITTPSPTQPPSIVPNCSKFYFVEPGTSCSAVLSVNGITEAQLYAWNSGVGPNCSGMWASVYLCVGVLGGGPSSTSTTRARTATTASNGIATPSPVQPPGVVGNCNKFFFVPEGTSCSTVLNLNGITEAQLFAWNSGVNSDCSGLWANVYVCVGVMGGGQPTTTSSRTSATFTAANGIATPSPLQPPGVVPNCNKSYFVKAGTSCSTVLSVNGITEAQLFAWNSGVNSDCSGLWANVYVCVAVGGGSQPTSTTRTTSTTTRGNGVTTPTPIQPGMVSNCKSLYKVADGDDCTKISTKTSVSIDNIKKWNTQLGLGAACNPWLGYYLCIAVL